MKKIILLISILMVSTYSFADQPIINKFQIEQWKMNGASKSELLFEGVIKEPKILNHCEITGYLNYDEKNEYWQLIEGKTYILCIGQKLKPIDGYIKDITNGNDFITTDSRKELEFIIGKK